MNKQFASDVLIGLTADKKYLSSKYFYNRRGNELFQQIMQLEEYYLTRAEYQIFDAHKTTIRELFASAGKFRLIELGVGDGFKTKLLLRDMVASACDFDYVPVDISQNALNQLATTLAREIPTLNMSPTQGDYFQILSDLKQDTTVRHVVLFVGSTIGNFTESHCHQFLQSMTANLNTGDMALIGFDLKKNPEKIIAAYNDKQGVTREFNLNLLRRINDELGASFDLEQFIHYPTYNPVTGMAESHLLSVSEQAVHIAQLNKTVNFEQWEPIHLEVSRKFSESELENLATLHACEQVAHLKDKNGHFVDAIWQIR